MTQKTKLEIIGEYRKDHPGPFCTRDGRPVRIITMAGGSQKYPIVAIVEGCDLAGSFEDDGSVFSRTGTKPEDLMCAREVPVAREFWVNKYKYRELSGAYPTKGMADSFSGRDRVECIHVREVLPGESE